eukprot:CAMPEP_0183295728 /NCGR_PEP_ID=MMETSP0160_2-20130417/3576_1 /TAXON_ID=2839 ORGANISM="Odontella Sinensis, Strain Grunow 1884" /NCGR_SAMPLE_ID=MMETSP0160_2 /ASSEMBLY_ACC=CAM_ASM_000250 /LENGTH=300 /DNA_ID=CAMNT_0025457255 /DNA_START=191 /DNA_END=1089 /DNA_ORIENTATION=-
MSGETDAPSSTAEGGGNNAGAVVGLNGGLPLVPESVLKKRHDMDEMKAHRAAQQIANPRGNRKVFDKTRRSVRVRKPESFLARAVGRRNHRIRYERVRKKGMQKRASNRKVVTTAVVPSVANDDEDDQRRPASAAAALAAAAGEEETTEVRRAANSVGAASVFVVRVREPTYSVPPQVKNALSALRLRNANEGVFVRYTETARRLLHLVEPFVIYGVVSKSTVADLINRRGHGKLDGKRVPLSDNTVIEKALGEKDGLICVEDLVHEIHTVGESFKAASNFLWPFRLTAFRSKFQKQKLG